MKNMVQCSLSQNPIFFTEDGNYKYEGEEEKLPWKDPSEMLMSLVNVKQLVYKRSKQNEQTDSFEDIILTVDVTANAEVEFNSRIVDTEEITTNAGTFLCTVIEAAQDEIQKKLWMINNKPGVYAKLIIEKPGMYGAYSLEIYELNKIQ